MEAYVDLAAALGCAVMLIALYMIVRIAMRTESTPPALRSELLAYMFAVPFTIAIAASVAYGTYALFPFMGIFIGLGASIAVHSLVLWGALMIAPALPAKPIQDQATTKPAAQQNAATAAA